MRDSPLLARLEGQSDLRAADDLDTVLSRLLRFCRRAGITRVGDLTGLDRTGLPVVQAIRPGALSEVTGLGRGLSRSEAAVGAIMETLERSFAERIEPHRVFAATADDLGIAAGKFDHVVRPERSAGWRRVCLPWIFAVDVLTGRDHAVPLELVHTRYSEPPLAGDGMFARSSTGLACHTNATAAFAHGLLECIERDAIARAFATHGFFDRHRIGLTGTPGHKLESLLEVAERAGLAIALWYAPSPTGVPVVWCQVIEANQVNPVLAIPTEGYAAGTTLEAAICTALLEALATRPAVISGARDDQTRLHYNMSLNSPIARRARELILGSPAVLSADAIDGPEVDLARLPKRVAAANLGPVLCVSVAADVEAGVECVRVILPEARPLTVLR